MPSTLALMSMSAFSIAGSPERDRPKEVWFAPDPAFDAALRARFLADCERAAAGRYSGWLAEPDTALALIRLLDQLPRNLFRSSPRAFASDDQARSAAREAVARGFGRLLPPASPHTDSVLDYARRHRDIIARFGRFPHRNRVLGRAPTAEEEAFLRSPGSAF